MSKTTESLGWVPEPDGDAARREQLRQQQQQQLRAAQQRQLVAEQQAHAATSDWRDTSDADESATDIEDFEDERRRAADAADEAELGGLSSPALAYVRWAAVIDAAAGYDVAFRLPAGRGCGPSRTPPRT